ncbi:MAG: 5-(carboxyamino)imidazole ribonucleotide synthase [Haloferacaceae archaeon]
MTQTLPGPTLGVVGGGQLGRMLAEAAAPLGVEVVVLDPTPDCPAATVARDQVVGDFDDPDAFADLAARTDALTFEIELADPDLLERVGGEADVPVHPSPDTLRLIEDKLVQKRALGDADIPVPAFHRVDDAADLRDALDEFGAVMLKARTGGYDGRGNVPVEDESDAEAALDAVGGPAMAENFVDFARELSVIGVKGRDEVRTFPAGENVHREEILRETIVPARTRDEVLDRAQSVAHDVLDVMEGRGVYGIELFETREGEILVNEIAPRPHNSGHWTIEGAHTSQFEQHVRAVLGWPLGPAERRDATVMTNALGDVSETQEATLRGVGDVLETPGAHLHWYGKRDVRPLRKMGHVTVVPTDDASADVETLLRTARDLRDGLTFTGASE